MAADDRTEGRLCSMKPNPEDRRATVDRVAAGPAGVIDAVQAIAEEWQGDPDRGSLRVDDLYDEATGLPR